MEQGQNKNQNQNRSKSTTKKAIIITAVIIVIMAIAAVLLVVLLPKTEGGQNPDGQGQANVFESDYSDTMKLYKALNGREILVEDLEAEAKKQNQSISVFVDDMQKGTIGTDAENEYITFTQVQEEEDSPETAIDFVYHETIGEEDSFVLQSGEDTYQHFNGAITNEFKTIDEALNDHLLIHK